MNPNPISLTPFQTIDVAAEKMRELGIRRFPIVKKDKLVGIISVSDLITKAIAKSSISGSIGPFVKKRTTTVWDQTPIRVAHHIMRIANKQILGLLVLSTQVLMDTNYVPKLAHNEVMSIMHAYTMHLFSLKQFVDHL